MGPASKRRRWKTRKFGHFPASPEQSQGETGKQKNFTSKRVESEPSVADNWIENPPYDDNNHDSHPKMIRRVKCSLNRSADHHFRYQVLQYLRLYRHRQERILIYFSDENKNKQGVFGSVSSPIPCPNRLHHDASSGADSNSYASNGLATVATESTTPLDSCSQSVVCDEQSIRMGGVEFTALNDTFFQNQQTNCAHYLLLPKTLTPKQRKVLHECCLQVNLFHHTIQFGPRREDRQLVVATRLADIPVTLPVATDAPNHFESDLHETASPAIVSALYRFKPWHCRRKNKDSTNMEEGGSHQWQRSRLVKKKHKATKRPEQPFGASMERSPRAMALAALDALLDQPGDCLRDSTDFLDFAKCQDADLSSIPYPSSDDSGESTPLTDFSTGPCFLVVDSADAMKQCLQQLRQNPPTALAFDIEAYNLSKHTQISCLLQLSTDTGYQYLIDPLVEEVWDLIPELATWFLDPSIVKVGHALGGLDVRCLDRDFGLLVVNAFDTYEASKVLRLPEHGLVGVCSHYGLAHPDLYRQLKDEYQGCDWRVRPLTPDMILYGRYDVHYLLPLRQLMMRDLVRYELWDRSPYQRRMEATEAAAAMKAIQYSIQQQEEAIDFVDDENHYVQMGTMITEDITDVNNASMVQHAVQDGLYDIDDEDFDDGNVLVDSSIAPATVLRLQPRLMQVITQSLQRCRRDLWKGTSHEDYLRNGTWVSLLQLAAVADKLPGQEDGIRIGISGDLGQMKSHRDEYLEDWRGVDYHLPLYEELVLWRDRVATELECLPGFVVSLDFLVTVAWKQPTDDIALRRIAFLLPQVLQDHADYRDHIFNLVIQHQDRLQKILSTDLNDASDGKARKLNLAWIVAGSAVILAGSAIGVVMLGRRRSSVHTLNVPMLRRSFGVEEGTIAALSSSAVKGLRKAIVSLLSRRIRMFGLNDGLTSRYFSIESLDQELAHFDHCMSGLALLLDSLAAAMAVFRETQYPLLLEKIKDVCRRGSSNNQKALQAMMTYLFFQLLRLHDGIIFCVSGECRHRGDVDEAKLTRFPSHLNRGGRRKDGYTQLYKEDRVYSGTSWDEIMDGNNGLQFRLTRKIKPFLPGSTPESIWEKLISNKNCSEMDTLLNQVEARLQQIQRDFKAFVEKIARELGNTLRTFEQASSFTITMLDKTEKMKLKFGKSTVLQLERLASCFQIQDSEGVLPIRSHADWTHAMSFPPELEVNDTLQKKRRRLIDESDDAPEKSTSRAKWSTAPFNEPPIPPKVQFEGLVVREKVTAENISSSEDMSLSGIKRSLGVDGEALSKSRETLDAEQAGTDEAATIVDNFGIHSHYDETKLSVWDAEGKIKSLRLVVRKLQCCCPSDKYDIWDARECLREAMMRAGNLYLWSESRSDNWNNDRMPDLQRSLKYFLEANELVLAQMSTLGEMDESEVDDLKIALHLLQGQAITNAGIALTEAALLFESHAKDFKRGLKSAIRNFQKVDECLGSIRSTCESSFEYGVDFLKACQMVTLSRRWKGIALWHLGRRDEAFLAFEKASLKDEISLQKATTISLDFALGRLDLHTECYYSWAVFADLARNEVEKAPIACLLENVASYDECFQYHVVSLECAMKEVGEIDYLVESLSMSGPTFRQEKEILSTGDLMKLLQDAKSWWSSRKSLTQNLKVDTSYAVPRSLDTTVDPRRRQVFVIDRRCFQRKCSGSVRRETRASRSISSFGNYLTRGPACEGVTCLRYRKWGDELLSAHGSSESGLSLPFPSSAPEMPPHIALAFAERNRSKT